MVHSVTAGNTSDQASTRDHVSRISKMLEGHADEPTIVGDCKMVDGKTIGRILDAGFRFVSLVPDTYKARRQFIEGAWEACPDPEDWPVLARVPGRTKADPDKLYRGWSSVEPFAVLTWPSGEPEAEPEASTTRVRFLVTYSTTLARRFEKSLPKKLKKQRASLAAFVKKSNKKGFSCADDARRAADAATAKAPLLDVTVAINEERRKLKRARPGRPSAGDKPPTETVWTVSLDSVDDQDAIELARQRNSCFMLITDHLPDEEGWDDASVLQAYRKQFLIEGHTGFRWLKSEAAVAPMFLKTPTRIRAMGLVLILALMVRNYIQFTLRANMRKRDLTLPHPFTKKQETKLTTEMAFVWFAEIQAIHVSDALGQTVRVRPRLREPARLIMELVGISELWFYDPPPPTRDRGRKPGGRIDRQQE